MLRHTLVAALAALVACSTATTGPPSASGAPAGSSTEVEAELIPEDELPAGPEALAGELVTTTRKLKADIDRWRKKGKGRRAALFGAIRQQRIYQTLVAKPKLFAKVERRLPEGLARFARENVGAATRLLTLVEPLKELPDWATYRPAPAGELKRYYNAGRRRFGIPWQILASLNFVESRFGRILGPSSAGALGPMQFLPSTWAVYGNGGDIMDPRDSIIGAARYLRASGAPGRMRSALHSYNASYEYVAAIRTYARQMRRDPRNYFAYYLWQVYVLTTEGNVQLTGPGGVRPAK